MAEQPADISPQTVQQDATLRIVDIRSAEERLSEIGFIPGSIWISEEVVRADPDILWRNAAEDCQVVLACQSGRRSRQLADELHQAGVLHLSNLKGGLLGWGGQGFPLCCAGETADVSVTADLWRRQVRSCFLVETIESIEDLDEAEADPVAVVTEVINTFASPWSVAGARTALDHLSEAARRQGHPMDHIASNVSRFYDLAERVTDDAS